MSDLTDRYLAAWNASDPSARAQAVADVFTEGATYVDPLVDICGHDQLEATIAAVQGQFPGFVFTLLDEPDSHHDVVRFRWGLGPAGGDPVVEGFDVATLDGRRIATVTGFLAKVPS